MIDTACLVLPQHKIQIKHYDAFSPSAKGLFQSPYYGLGGKGYFQCVLNPSNKSKYQPRLTLTKRFQQGGFTINLKIEFSAPKLIFGNNFQELNQSHFDEVVGKLFYELHMMGIVVDLNDFKQASVSSIHYGRNITLDNYLISSMIINLISKCDLSKRLDTGNTDFRNNGHAVRFHTNSYEISFYDKVKDLEQAKISEKRAIEKDNAIQLSLFDEPKKSSELKQEILRMEVRLSTRKNIKNMLGKLNFDVNKITFQDLFSKGLSKKVLLHFWDKLEPNLRIILLSQTESDALFYKFMSLGIKPKKAMYYIGAMKFIEKMGIRGSKNLLKRGSYSILKELENVDLDSSLMGELREKMKGG